MEYNHTVRNNLAQLRQAGVNPTRGDTRCIIHGHLIRLVVWRLRQQWNRNQGTNERLARLANEISNLGTVERIEALVTGTTDQPAQMEFSLAEQYSDYGFPVDWIHF